MIANSKVPGFSRLTALAIILALSACGKQQGDPPPPVTHDERQALGDAAEMLATPRPGAATDAVAPALSTTSPPSP